MWYFIILSIASVVLFFISFSGTSKLPARPENQFDPDYRNNSHDTSKLLTKAELKKKLKDLANSPAPQSLKPGAMCYEMAMRPDSIDYICPNCGEKTVYSSDLESTVNNATSCRYYVQSIHGVELSLDESTFCKKCSPRVEFPSIVLYIRFADEKTARKIDNPNAFDLELLDIFLKGKYVYESDYGEEKPIKNHIKQLENFLNIKL